MIINTAVMGQLIIDAHCQRINVCGFFDSNNFNSKNGLIMNSNVGSGNTNIWNYQSIYIYSLGFMLLSSIGINVIYQKQSEKMWLLLSNCQKK